MTAILFIALIIMFFEIRKVKSSLRAHRTEIVKLKKALKSHTEDHQSIEDGIETSDDKVSSLEGEVLESSVTNSEYETVSSELSPADQEPINVEPEEMETPFEKVKPSKEASPYVKTLKKIFSVESIIAKLGILLLLIGTGFIFKYSYDVGIITEKITLIFGMLFGFVLIYLGFKVKKKSRLILGQVLLGGGIATQFITIYSAYQVYELIVSSTAFASMVIVSIMALLIAVRVDGPAMAIVGVVGGLLTPFVVDLDFIGLQGLGLYIFSLALCSMLIYIYKKWITLLIGTILGVFVVTSILSSNGTFTVSESYQFTYLLVALLMLFNGVDFVSYLSKKDDHFIKNINTTLFALLPLMTLLQMYMVLDITPESWSLISSITAVVYLGLTYLTFKKRGRTLVTQITYGLFSLFTVLAVFLYFGGDVRTVIIVSLSLLFYYVYQKDQQPISRVIAHLLFVLGFILSVVNFGDAVLSQGVNVLEFITNLVIIVLMTVGILLQKDIYRLIMGVMVYEVFSVYIIYEMVYQLFDKHEPTAVLIIGLSIWLVVLYGLSRKPKFVPQLSIPLLSIIPVYMTLFICGENIFNWHYNLYDIMAMIFTALIIYLIGHDYFKRDKEKAAIFMKIGAYIILSLVFVCDLLLITEHAGYGLIILGSMTLLIKYFEPNREERLIQLITEIMLWCWVVLFGSYTVFGFMFSELKILSFGEELMMLPLIGDGINLILLYYILQILISNLNIRFVGHTLTYFIITYIHFNYSGDTNGTVTLLWAAYAIFNLAYNIIKVRREQVNISLGLIIFVATKLILVDFSTVGILWKIVTSMIFGVALLVLSYFIQPILKKNE